MEHRCQLNKPLVLPPQVMEKFTVYADKTTGIMPFRETPLKVSFVQYICAVFIVPLKIILLAILAIAAPVLSLIAPQTLARAAAYLFGVGSVEYAVDGVRRSDEKGIRNASPVAGDIVVVNATGPLDYLMWKCIARSSSIVCIALENGKVMTLGFKEWVDWCFSGSVSCCGDAITLAELPKDKAVFIVAEGTVTNGKSIVKFPRGFTLKGLENVKTLSTKVSPVVCSTVGPTSKFSWIIANMSSVIPSTRYRMKLSLIKNGASDDNIRATLAESGKMKVVGDPLTAETKREYLSALHELNNKNKKRV